MRARVACRICFAAADDMGIWTYMCEHPVASAVTCYFVVLEGHYLWRLAACLTFNMLMPRRPLSSVFRNYSVCTPTDLDAFLHMNNSRYSREMDFGRWGFYLRSRLHRVCIQHNTRVLHTASAIRFRKEVGLLMPFVVETRLMHWERQAVYFEQKLRTLHDGRVRSVCYSQQRLVGQLDADRLMQLASLNQQQQPQPPPARSAPAPVLRHLQDIIDASSQQLAEEEGRSK